MSKPQSWRSVGAGEEHIDAQEGEAGTVTSALLYSLLMLCLWRGAAMMPPIQFPPLGLIVYLGIKLGVTRGQGDPSNGQECVLWPLNMI